jgi:hypothetical protein
MSRGDVDNFFHEYVTGFMFADIQREIDRARGDQDAGNFLCALALLCYTEVLGGIRRNTLAPGNGRLNFECFFRELGPGYEQLLDSGVDAYGLFRCGMAHEYLIKGKATVSMLKGVEPCGIAIASGGHYYFTVERYFEDFRAAALQLQTDLMAQPSPSLPIELSGP